MSLSLLPIIRKAIFDPDIAIDLGTANTRLYACGRGLIADEPSAVVVNSNTSATSIANVKSGDKRTIQPLKGGVIVDIDAAVALIKPLLYRTRRFGLMHPRALACIPTDAIEEDRLALVEVLNRSGISKVSIVPEPIAAAIGAGIDIGSPYAIMIVDIGGGVTDIAVIRSSALLTTSAIRIACGDLQAAVQNMIKERYSISLLAGEAIRLIREVSGCYRDIQERSLIASGTTLLQNKEVIICVSAEEINRAIDPIISTIVQTICSVVCDLPPKTACEVIESGIFLTGGGAILPGIADRISAETAIDVRIVDAPLLSVINGASKILNNFGVVDSLAG